MSDVAEPFHEFRPVEKHQTWTPSGPVLSHLPDTAIQTLRERAVATVADPDALGLWALATGTWMIATVIGGFVPSSFELALVPSLALFGGLAQFIAGLYSFRRASMLNATVFTCLGAFNAVAGAMLILPAVGVAGPGTGFHNMFGFLLESFTFIALMLSMAAMQRNVVLSALLGFLCVGYCLTGISQFLFVGGPQGAGLGAVAAVGGAFLFGSALFAYYLGAALVVNSAYNRNRLPIMGEA
jgi:succinate-acetate transporter protein